MDIHHGCGPAPGLVTIGHMVTRVTIIQAVDRYIPAHGHLGCGWVLPVTQTHLFMSPELVGSINVIEEML